MDDRLINYARVMVGLQVLTILALLLVAAGVLFSYSKSREAQVTCLNREYQGSKQIICQDYLEDYLPE